jgi:hypothetical protein
MCRFVKDPQMWATLAAMAMAAKELNTAETAFAAIDEVDKTHFVRKVKQIPTEEGRNAELAVYRRKPDEAESLLMQVRARRRGTGGVPGGELLIRKQVGEGPGQHGAGRNVCRCWSCNRLRSTHSHVERLC